MDTDDGYWLFYPCWHVEWDTPVHNVFAKPFVPPTPTPSSNVEMPNTTVTHSSVAAVGVAAD